jgi:hypothetical protein
MQAFWAIVGVIVGAVAASLGGYLGQRSLARASHRERWADQAASSLADALMLLSDLRPEVLLNEAQEFDESRIRLVVEAIQDEQRVIQVRREISVLSSGHPDAQVREEASKLQVYIGYLRELMDELRISLLEHDSPHEKTVQSAQWTWNEAHRVRHWLEEHLHR